MAITEIELTVNVPKLVSPGTYMVVQNASLVEVNVLYVSAHGDIDKVWMEVGSGRYVKFAEPTYLMQRTMYPSATFPVIEGS